MPFLLIDKPAGMTSHDVVARVRRITGVKRVGHSGTLDPFATGLLIVGVERECTKHLGAFLGMRKTYSADFAFGVTTETLDPESPECVVPKSPPNGPQVITSTEINAGIRALTGDILQIPPMYSALKRGGKKMYELARAGKTIAIEPRPVHVYSWEWHTPPEAHEVPYPLPVTLSFLLTVSAGTYIRALARDLGAACGTGGYVRYLRRTHIGNFSVADAVHLHDLTPEHWLDFARSDLYRELA